MLKKIIISLVLAVVMPLAAFKVYDIVHVGCLDSPQAKEWIRKGMIIECAQEEFPGFFQIPASIVLKVSNILEIKLDAYRSSVYGIDTNEVAIIIGQCILWFCIALGGTFIFEKVYNRKKLSEKQ